VEDGEVIRTNVGAYAGDLILYSASRDGIQQMLDALAEFCKYTHMDVNVKKWVSISQTWGPKDELEQQCLPFKMKKYGHGMVHEDNIPIEDISIYLGTPIGFGREECKLHRKGVIESMKKNILQVGEGSLTICQKLEGIKFMELPRIDHRMMCADLDDKDLRYFDQWLRGTIMSWLRVTGIPTCVFGMSWRDGGFTIPSL
jgi:hypothetical protein